MHRLYKGKHIHAYIEFDKKVNILSASKLDLTEIDKNSKLLKNIHGEYQAVKNKKNVIDYTKKITTLFLILKLRKNLRKN